MQVGHLGPSTFLRRHDSHDGSAGRIHALSVVLHRQAVQHPGGVGETTANVPILDYAGTLMQQHRRPVTCQTLGVDREGCFHLPTAANDQLGQRELVRRNRVV